MIHLDPAAWTAFCADPSGRNFEPVYEQSKRLVWTVCWRVVRNEEDAPDAFQGAYARLVGDARRAAAAWLALDAPQERTAEFLRDRQVIPWPWRWPVNIRTVFFLAGSHWAASPAFSRARTTVKTVLASATNASYVIACTDAWALCEASRMSSRSSRGSRGQIISERPLLTN
jgi:hypothetical protein